MINAENSTPKMKLIADLSHNDTGATDANLKRLSYSQSLTNKIQSKIVIGMRLQFFQNFNKCLPLQFRQKYKCFFGLEGLKLM